MKSFFSSILAVTVICYSGMAGSEQAPLVANTLNFSKSIDLLEKDALDGSASASSEVIRYYMYDHFNLAQLEKWSAIGAENGDPSSEFQLYTFLMDKHTPESRRRAFFWLKKSLDGGYDTARTEMDACFPSKDPGRPSDECLRRGEEVLKEPSK
ncbi:hypothetical protein [Dyella sp.]|uniref:hypothetical protein n=1 Tax=Dyella sp. TaxID=1869338 RepID=UPI002ED5AA77